MESIKPTIVKFAIDKFSFIVKSNIMEEVTINIEKKINCKVDKNQKTDRLYVTSEIIAHSVPVGALEFSAECRAVVAAQTHDLSDNELKERIERVYVPLVDKEVVERVKKITEEMGQPVLDLTIGDEAIEI